MSHSLSLAFVFALLLAVANHSAAVEISESQYEGREQYTIKTQSCTWVFDRDGGGFSRLMDTQESDWIGFSKDPLSKFPQSAAAGYRGIPNCVFVGSDKGAGHPGFDQCKSFREGNNRIVTESKSGKWKWQWTFHEHYAEFEMLTAGDSPWWFLYEGPPGGDYSPKRNYWGTDSIRLTRDIPANKNQKFGNWQTLYVGRDGKEHVLAIHQLQGDDRADTIWFLGSEDGGSVDSSDGMIVVGFGRGPGTQPLLRGAGQKFRVGFVSAAEKMGQNKILKQIRKRLALAAVERPQ